MRLTALDPIAGELAINGVRRDEPYPLEPGQDCAVRIGLHLLALRGGRDLTAWGGRLDWSRWCLVNPTGPKIPPFGPVAFAERANLAARHGLPPRERCRLTHRPGCRVLARATVATDAAGVPGDANGATPAAFPASAPAPATPTDAGALPCPVGWRHADVGDLMHIAVHDSLRGDPILGEDAHQRFHATRFNDRGQALDASARRRPGHASRSLMTFVRCRGIRPRKLSADCPT